MKYYEVWLSGVTIREVEVEKESPLCVWIKGSRSAKESSYLCYYKTRVEAKNRLIDHCQRLVDQARGRLQHEEDKLKKAMSL
jgi:hypothetical protein